MSNTKSLVGSEAGQRRALRREEVTSSCYENSIQLCTPCLIILIFSFPLLWFFFFKLYTIAIPHNPHFTCLSSSVVPAALCTCTTPLFVCARRQQNPGYDLHYYSVFFFFSADVITKANCLWLSLGKWGRISPRPWPLSSAAEKLPTSKVFLTYDPASEDRRAQRGVGDIECLSFIKATGSPTPPSPRNSLALEKQHNKVV